MKWSRRHPELGTSPVPVEAYVSPGFFGRELDSVFRRSWLNVAREEDLPEEGSYYALDLAALGTRLLLTRGRDDVVRAFHNVCTHRGTRLVPPGRGRSGLLTCRYHGWTFTSAGKLAAVPDEKKFADLDKSRCGLRQIQCDIWQGFVFVHLDPAPERSLAESVRDLEPAFARYPFARLVTQVTYTAEVEANWKVALDIGEEPYHFLFVHRRSIPDSHTGVGQELAFFPSIRLFDRHRSASVVANPDHRMRPSERIAFGQGATIIQGADPREWAPGLNLDQVANWAFDVHVLYPNTAVLLGVGWTVVHRFWPISATRTRWETTLAMPPPGNAGEALSQEFSRILTRDLLREDLATVELNQAGLSAGALDTILFSDEEIMLRHNHYVTERIMSDSEGSAATSATGQPLRPRRLLVDRARIIDGTGRTPLEDHSILIEDGVIRALLPAQHASGVDAERIDAQGKTVIPGLIDMHAHLITGGFDSVIDTGASYDQRTQSRVLKQMLYWGVTGCHFSVQPLDNMAWLRRGSATGTLVGPRLHLSGPGVTAPGGWAGSNIADARLELDDPAEAAAGIARLAEAGVDFVKVFYDDMCCAFHRSMPKLKRPVMEAVVRAAHRFGLPVAVHVYEVPGHREVMEAGGDVLYHSAVTAPIDESYLALAKRMGSAYVATLSIYHDTYDPDAARRWAQNESVRSSIPAVTLETLAVGGPLDMFEAFTKRREMKERLPMIRDNLRRIHDAGIPFAVGPDTGVPAVFPGISVHREMELMCQAGVPAMAVLQAATRQAAALLGDTAGGSIERGKRADLLVLRDDPLQDILATRTVEAVIQSGRRIDRQGLLRSIMSDTD